MPTQRTKRHQRSSTVEIDDAPTTEQFLPTVVETTECGVHNARYGYACHAFRSNVSENWIFGICNGRAKAAGFDGEISSSSLRTRPYTRTA